MAAVVIGLGSNLGDPAAAVRDAVRRLESVFPGLRVSGLYASAPMYFLDQPRFVNAVAIVETGLGPRSVLAALKRIEAEMGRRPRARNGPREIDLDVVAYGVLAYRFGPEGAPAALEVPHPRAFERRFVLEPWADVDPGAVLPHRGAVADLLRSPAVAEQALERLSDA